MWISELCSSSSRKFVRYQPSDDTYLMLDALAEYRGDSALEIGVGSGIIIRELCNRFSIVIGTDIDLEALSYCNQSNDLEAELVCCSAANALSSSQKYDLIVSNPPYLPFDDNDVYDRTICGGVTGSDLAVEFIESSISLLSEHGAILLLLSSLSDLPQFYGKITSFGLSRRTILKKELFFESISVEEIRIF